MIYHLDQSPTDVVAHLKMCALKENFQWQDAADNVGIEFLIQMDVPRHTSVQAFGQLAYSETEQAVLHINAGVPPAEQRGAWISIGLLVVTSLFAAVLWLWDGIVLFFVVPIIMIAYLAFLAWQIRHDQSILMTRLDSWIGAFPHAE